ncbi:MAG TPA: galactoside O-acetyltransferase [bacterium]|nr:galactoside O-acetyltransferase [bacterium]
MKKNIYLIIFNKLFWFKVGIRSFIYKKLFKYFGKETYIFGKINVINPDHISIGSNSTINDNCFLNARDEIIIGDFVHISPGVIINTGYLDYNNKILKNNHISKSVIIKNGVWICSGVIVNPGITIGENSVVGAGSVVTKDIPSNVVVAGVPAEIIKNI